MPEGCCAGCFAILSPKPASSTRQSERRPSAGHGQYIIDCTGKIEDFYDVAKNRLGEGSYGTVSKGTRKGSNGGEVRAVKNIRKAQMKDKVRFRREISIMKMMDHPNVIKLYENFEDARCIYLVMELCDGGELFDRIIEAGHFREKQAAIIMEQIFRPIFYMHTNRVAHRDLKPENFLFRNKGAIEQSELKIIDFGLSAVYEPGQVLTTKAGTPYYVAPQVLQGKYDEKCDNWSCGVIMYVLLCGYPPFHAESDAEVLSKVRLGNYSFNAADWKGVSTEAKDLIRQLLRLNPNDRCTAEKALATEWVKTQAATAPTTLSPELFKNLRQFRTQNKLKKAALHVIATRLGDDQIKSLKQTFTALDKDGDGRLSQLELKNGLAQSGLADAAKDIQDLMADIDTDGSGYIDYSEFLSATLDQRKYIQEDICWSAFRVFDRNGDGKISPDELKIMLNNGDINDIMGSKSIEDLVKEIDGNGDGAIDFEEFMAMMRGKM